MYHSRQFWTCGHWPPAAKTVATTRRIGVIMTLQAITVASAAEQGQSAVLLGAEAAAAPQRLKVCHPSRWRW